MIYFDGKVAIVTGAASGIGEALSLYMAERGAVVVLADVNDERAHALQARIAALNGRARVQHTDVCKPQDVKALVDSTLREHGRLDFLFNNAGVGCNGEFQEMDLEQCRRVVDVNLWGVIYGCHYAYPEMIRQGHGQIVNVASIAGLIPGGLMTTYCAAKHAVVGFSLTLRSEARLYGVKVNVLCPGYVETPIHETTVNVTSYLNAPRDLELRHRIETLLRFPEPQMCVEHMLKGVLRDDAIIVSPREQRPFWWMYRLFPQSVPYVWSKIIRHIKPTNTRDPARHVGGEEVIDSPVTSL